MSEDLELLKAMSAATKHVMQPLAEYMASPDALTPQGMARRYADAEAAGVKIGTPDNPFPGLSPEEVAEMDAFKAELLRERAEGTEQLGWMVLGQRPNGIWEALTSVVGSREKADAALQHFATHPVLIGQGEEPVAYRIASVAGAIS